MVNYQISTKTDSTNSKSPTGSKLSVNYQISLNTNSANNNSTTGSKLVEKLPEVYYQ